ncbi:MAG: NADH-quinone oxidoreductase subunit NuoF, partial [FCB group bacterium]|nr:NADH-quinone oxidoreductase subunit NuoF [FCB group bacterium]
LGPCAVGPVAVVYPDGVFYQGIKPEDADELVQEHLLKGRPLARLNYKVPATEQIIPALKEISFFRQQEKVVLRNCGIIDPTRIEEYIAHDGYKALAQALTEMTPDQVIDVVKRSGLRGRGGAGFSTGLKWSFTRKAESDKKYVLCNADEGDPGAFMDRSVLEGDPHSVIEAMIIAGYAVGSDQGYVYVRAEYPLAVERLTKAIEQAREMGLLGNDIMGSGFNFDLEIRMGSGAFVCGEETALMRSIEGKRGEPRPRPPFPAIRGLWEKPSLLNNVETYANIPAILLKGADWFAAMGTDKSKGTKVFALAGAVNNTGLVEIPIGTPLGEIIYDIGGGIPNGKKFKAAQMGGPSGGCIPREHLNVPVDYESLQELGAIMGSGGLIVMDEDTCMVDMARFFLDFVQDESCGKCVPCRIGTKRMLEIVTRICEGRGEEGDIEKLIDLGEKIKETSLCGLGQTAPNPVLSAIRHFREEFEAHIRDKHCSAGVCPGLVRAPCMSACPAGVYVPGFVALVGEQRYAEALRLHRENNPFVSVCARVCFHTCEDKCRRGNLDTPVAIRPLKRFMVDQEVTVQIPTVIESEVNAAKKIAVIGAGPAGLSCAYFLARLGYRPTVFEAEPRPGGMLVQTIPAYRLPREELAREVRMIERMGVEIQTGMRLGKDFTLKSLRQEGYDAVFVAVGAPEGSRMRIPGEDAEGVTEAIRFLREYNLRGSVKVGDKVVVIGGGNAAVDAARTAVRLGAESVTILYRRTRDEMPAYQEEVEEAEHEGVHLQTLVSPAEIVVKDGKVAGVKCHPVFLGPFDKSGRRRPETREDESFIVEADQVIGAIGQSLDSKKIFDGIALTLNNSKFIMADPVTGQTSEEWIFSGGDATMGPSSVAEAVGGGERAAVGIDKYLTGEEHAFWRRICDVETSFDPDADPADYPRARMKLLPVNRRRNNFNEVEMPFTENVAVREARRCLRCDYRAKS